MDRRTQNRLEQERDRALRNADKEMEHLDMSYTRVVRDKDALIQKAFSVFSGDSGDFQRLMSRIEMNTSEFEKLLRKKRRFLEEDKKEATREFDRKTRERR